MIKACVFDLDGTLLNTLPTIAHYANRALAREGIAPYKVEDYPAFVGNGSRELLRRALAGRGAEGVDFERFHAEYVQDYDSAPSYMTRPYEGIDELLSLLREKGCRLAVLSNKPDTSIQLLVEEFFPARFDLVRGAREGVPLKPSPDALYDILECLGATPDECFYVGDGIPDMRIAKAAAVRVGVAALWGFTSPDLLLAEGGVGAHTPKEAGEIFLRSL